MELRLIGHAATILQSDTNELLLIDPYEPGGFGGKMNYAPIEQQVDVVVCSHRHADHCATHLLPGAPHLMNEAQGRAGAFRIRRHPVAHDEYGGSRRGGLVDMLEVEVDGWRILHGSDLGQAPEAEVVEALAGVDVFMPPVGGFYTVGAAQAWEWTRRLGARWVIPQHYKTPSCDLPIRGVAGFAAYFDRAHRVDGEAFRVEIDREPGLWVLPMSHDKRCAINFSSDGDVVTDGARNG